MPDQTVRLLLIDDDNILLMTLVSVMKRAGYYPITAVNGAEGFRLACDQKPDLIICDVQMPPPNGHQLKAQLSQHPATAEIPFLFLTARDLPDEKIQALQQGADDYITKPFDVDELVARVRNVLRRVEIGRQRGLREADEKIHELRQSITANFNHEMRTPLSNLLATLDLALREKFTSHPLAIYQYIEAAQGSAHRLRSLIDDLILLNTIDQGRVSNFRQEIDPRFHILKPVEGVMDRWEEKRLKLVYHVPDDAQIYAPKHEFAHIVTHLADNAAKFSPPEGTIEVRVDPNGPGGCILTIADQGPGIPGEFREKVFERYFQISQGDTRQFGGLGVGLTLARAVARELHGEITILDSDQGCQVCMEIPPSPPDWQIDK